MNVFFARQRLEGNFRNPRVKFPYDAIACFNDGGSSITFRQDSDDGIKEIVGGLISDSLFFGDCGQSRFIFSCGAVVGLLKNHSLCYDSMECPLHLISAVNQSEIRYKDTSDSDLLSELVAVSCNYFYRSGYLNQKPIFLPDPSPLKSGFDDGFHSFSQIPKEPPKSSSNLGFIIPVLSAVKNKKVSIFNAFLSGFAFADSDGVSACTFASEMDAIESLFELIRTKSANSVIHAFRIKWLKSILIAGCIRSGINIPDYIHTQSFGPLFSAEGAFPFMSKHEEGFPMWLIHKNAIGLSEFDGFYVTTGNGEEKTKTCAANLCGWALAYLNQSPIKSSLSSGKSVSTKRK